MHRYSDPGRLNAARNAAIYLGKSDRDNVRRPLSIIKKGHVPEIFRGEMVEFEFIDVSKEVYDHLTTYTTRNMRVAGGNRALTSDDYELPSDKVNDIERVQQYVEMSMDNYRMLLEHETPQVARSAMPVAAKMNPFVLQFNFVTLMQSVFPQRLWEMGAQGNTVNVVNEMWRQVHSVDPELWNAVYEAFGTPAVTWKEAKKRMDKLTLCEVISALENEDGGRKATEVISEKFGKLTSMW